MSTTLFLSTMVFIFLMIGALRAEDPKVPKQKMNLVLTPLSPIVVEVRWSSPVDEAKIIAYVLHYNDSSQQNSERVVFRSGPYMLTDLIPDTIYHMQLVGFGLRGELVRSALVQVKTPEYVPAEPKKVQAESINSTAIFVEWRKINYEYSGVIRGFYVFYAEVSDNGESIGNTEGMLDTKNAEKTEVVISGLKPGTTYSVTVAAYTGKGDGYRSRPRTVKTDDRVPVYAPRRVRVVSHTTTTMMLEWDEPEISSEEIEGYRIYYTTNPYMPIDRWQKETVRNSRLLFITGLQPLQTYYITVAAFSKSGKGALSEAIMLITRKEEPMQIKNLVVTPLSPIVVEVRWSGPVDNEKILSYTLYYNESSQTNSGQVTLIPLTRRYMLTDLTPDTIYHIQLVAPRERGDSVKSTLVQVKTPEYIPAKPKKVQAESINSTAIFVEWRKINSEYPGVIRGFYVFYAEVNDNGETLGKTEEMLDTKDAEKTMVVIGGLKPSTTYSVTVAAYTKKGDGYRSRPRSVKTDGRGPPAPSQLIAEVIQENPMRVRVTWQKPENSYGEITGYKLYWGPKDEFYDKNVNLAHNRLSYIPPNLDRGVTYEFHLVARNVNGYGETAVTTMDIPSKAHFQVSSANSLNLDQSEFVLLAVFGIANVEHKITLFWQVFLDNGSYINRLLTYSSVSLTKLINGMEEIKARLESLENKVEVQQKCDNGWVSYKTSCYLFEDRTPLNWQQAAGYCSELNGNLLVLKTGDQEAFITSFLERLYKGKTKYKSFVWIGATDANDKEEWLWYTDGSPVFHEQSRLSGSWQTLNQSHVTMNCAGLDGKKDFQSSANLCKKKAHFICEKKV